MEDNIKKTERNSAKISGDRIKAATENYQLENVLIGHESATPVSVAIRQFIKEEFSKIKLK